MIGKNLRHHLKLAVASFQLARRFDVLIEKGVTIKHWRSITLGRHCTLQSGVYLNGSNQGKAVRLGDYVAVAANCMLLGTGGITVGDHSHFGPGVVVTSQFGDSTAERLSSVVTLKYLEVTIGKGCWIGSGSVIMPGTILGDRCVVAPNSVVFGLWGDDVTLSGNPARKVKRPKPPSDAES